MRKLFFIIIASISTVAYGQSYLTVSGVVMDEETSEPLIFASVGIQGRSIGTISNTIGEFDFHIPVENREDMLEIQMLGYETFRMSVAEILDNEITQFKLARISKFLEEVVITDSLNGAEVYTIAVNRIESNYPQQPFMMDAFYRDLKAVGGRYVALLEAAVKIYDKDYAAPKNKFRLRERVALVEVRKSLGYDNKFTSFFDHTNLLEDILLHNNVRYRQFPDDMTFLNSLKREDSDFYDGRKVFVIMSKEDDRLKIFVDSENFSIIRLEYLIGEGEEIIATRQNMHSRMGSMKKILEFREYAGKMFLSHIDLYTEINWYDDLTEKLTFTTNLHQQLLINKVYPETTQKIGTTEKMKRFGLQYQHSKYNKEFWDNYNVIKDTPLDMKIVADLEKDISLEKQFQDN